MSFRLSHTASQYFSKLDRSSKSGKFPFKWDKYYLCFMAGAMRGELGDEPPGTDEFEKEFIMVYRPNKMQIVASLIAAELERQGIDSSVETEVSQVMNQVLDPESNTSLSTAGHTLMNRYAQGGFEILSEEIEDPRDLAGFLQTYHALYCVD